MKTIEQIGAGELVWAYDLITLEWKTRHVVETHVHDYEGTLVAFTVNDELIEATSNHPIWVVEGEGLARRELPEHVPPSPPGARVSGRWVDAGNLQVGDVLLLRSGPATIRRLSTRQVRERVYNFEVDELHTYAVGSSECWYTTSQQFLQIPRRHLEALFRSTR